MYQKLTIVGNLGRDPEMRYMPDGTAVTNLSVATSRKWNNAAGQPQQETTWFRVSVWGKQAEACHSYLAKGRMVLVEGRLKPDASGNPKTFTRNDGSTGASFEVHAETVRFLGGKGDKVEDTDEDEDVIKPDEDDDDIPF